MNLKNFGEVLINAFQRTGNPFYLIRMTDMFIYFGEISKAEKLAEEFYRMDDKSIEFVKHKHLLPGIFINNIINN